MESEIDQTNMEQSVMASQTTIPNDANTLDGDVTIVTALQEDDTGMIVSQDDELVSIAISTTDTLPTSGLGEEEDVFRRNSFWSEIIKVTESQKSEMILADKMQRIKRVLDNSKAGRTTHETPKFMFYVRSKQFTLKRAPELGWSEDVICVPTKEEDTSEFSLLRNWRQVAVAENIYDIIKVAHEGPTSHKSARQTYNEVQSRYTRIPRHLCQKFINLCPECMLMKERRSLLLATGGTLKRTPNKQLDLHLQLPAKIPRISRIPKIHKLHKISNMCKVNINEFTLKGLIAALFTPFEPNGDVNTKVLSRYVDSLHDDHVNSVFVLGTTAEGLSLTLKERKEVSYEWVKAAQKKMSNVIVQVGGGNLKETMELALHALSIGASAIAVLPPLFYKPSTPEQLISYLKQVANTVPTMPLYYYHIPMKTGVNFTMMEILRAFEENPFSNFKGAKFVSEDLVDFSLSVNVCKDKYQMIYSHDGMILPSMVLGGEAYVGSTFNFAGKLFTRMIDSYNGGDLQGARGQQFRIHAFLDVVNRFDKRVERTCLLKHVMAMARFDVGPPRSPLTQLAPKEIERLRTELTDIGFFEWIN